MLSDSEIFSRTRRLLGDSAMDRLANAKVIVFGIGGVGSWCAESLVRSGLGHITLVDCDRVSPSNINRQLMATTETVGQLKVDALRQHLLTVNPRAEIETRAEVYTAETADNFNLDSYDYVIDAIDSLRDKALLIERATAAKTVFFSSMGAALKLDPTRVEVAEFYKVKGCPLARALRQRFKKQNIRLRRKFLCVYSDELLPNLGTEPDEPSFNLADPDGPRPSEKARINGSLMHITAIFGLTLAGLVLKNLTSTQP